MTVESKLKTGTFTLGAGEDLISVATQATNVRIVPKVDEAGDPLEVLSGDVLTGDSTTTWGIQFKQIQDFTDAEGVQNYSWDHEGETVPYSWQPNPAGPTYTGNVRVTPIEVGGDVAKRLDVDVEWQLSGKPNRAFPVGP